MNQQKLNNIKLKHFTSYWRLEEIIELFSRNDLFETKCLAYAGVYVHRTKSNIFALSTWPTVELLSSNTPYMKIII